MIKAPIPTNENERQRALDEYRILDTMQEEQFDAITKTAALVCGCKIALVSLIDRDRQWFKSKYGLEAEETPRDISYCGHAIMDDELFIVEDAALDERFCDNPLFLAEPHVRFYAGAPLITPQGYRIGTLCVIDSESRSLNEQQKLVLKTLAQQVIGYFELRKQTETLQRRERQHRRLLDNMLEGMVIHDHTGKIIDFNPMALEVLGLTENQLLGRDSLDPRWQSVDSSGQPVPGDQHPAMRSLRNGEVLREQIMGVQNPDSGLRWLRINSVPMGEGESRHVVATFQDITELVEKTQAMQDYSVELNDSLKEQKVLRSMLSIGMQAGSSLEKKLSQALEALYGLEWLQVLPKGGVFLVKDQSLSLLVSKDLGETVEKMCTKVASGQCLCGRAFATKQIVHASCVDHRHENTFEGIAPHGHYNVPILAANQEVLGVIVLYLAHGHQKEERELRFLQAAAEIFALIIETDRLQSSLLESNVHLDLALEGAGLGIWDWDLRDNSVRFDRRWAAMLGHDISEIEMQLSSWESRVHPEDLAKCYEDIQAYMAGETAYYENIHRMRHKDGYWVYILDRGRFSEWDEDGKPIRFTGTHFDITELQNTKQKLSLLYQNSPFGFAFCDLEGRLLDVNQKYEEITGYSFAELQQLSYWEITPSEYEEQEALQLQSLEKRGHYGPYRKQYRRKDGSRIDVELNGFRIEDFDGKQGIWSIVEDISERVKQEAELSQQKQLAAHNAKLASIGELAAGVGHEINNPLAIVKGYLASIERKLVKSGPIATADLLTYVNKAEIASDRIAQIVKGLRNFSRSDDEQKEQFCPSEAIQETVYLIHEIYQRDGIELRLELLTPSEVLVMGNRGKFQQVIMNLISNAKDALHGRPNKAIGIRVNSEAKLLSIDIQDNGAGIPESVQAKIFDPFFTTKGVNQGTGIGLSLVHKFIEEMQGQLSFNTVIDQGTCFSIRLPILTVEASMPASSSVVPKEPVLLSGKVLLVDDEEEIRKILAAMLEDFGLQVTEASQGEEALQIFMESNEDFSLIISDMKMPVLDGPGLLQKIRQQQQKTQPIFLFATGGVQMDLENPELAIHQMMDGVFYKPFQRQQIFALLAQKLAERKPLAS